MGEETTSPVMGPQWDEAEVFLPAVSKLNSARLASFRMSSDGPEAEQEHPFARCMLLQLHFAPMAFRQSCRTSGLARKPTRSFLTWEPMALVVSDLPTVLCGLRLDAG